MSCLTAFSLSASPCLWPVGNGNSPGHLGVQLKTQRAELWRTQPGKAKEGIDKGENWRRKPHFQERSMKNTPKLTQRLELVDLSFKIATTILLRVQENTLFGLWVWFGFVLGVLVLLQSLAQAVIKLAAILLPHPPNAGSQV